MHPRSSILAVAAIGLLSLAAAAPVGAANPPGNNGTVKVDHEVFDDLPDNEPHAGCIFQVDFYGFDQGNLFADVRFVVQPPTGKAVTLQTDNGVFIGEDAAGGGTDLDATRDYDLTDALTAFDPHPQQGYHVKVAVRADGSQGAQTKYKVFWTGTCEVPPPPV